MANSPPWSTMVYQGRRLDIADLGRLGGTRCRRRRARTADAAAAVKLQRVLAPLQNPETWLATRSSSCTESEQMDRLQHPKDASERAQGTPRLGDQSKLWSHSSPLVTQTATRWKAFWRPHSEGSTDAAAAAASLQL